MKRIAGVVLCAAAAACAGSADTPRQDETAASPTIDSAVAGAIGDTVEDSLGASAAERATATMRDTAGTELGVLTLTQTTEGIAVQGQLTGVPAGQHGFHVHTTGRCDPPFESAGGHWNPTSRQHGTENPQGPHTGDMMNVSATEAGVVEVAVTTRGGSFSGEVQLLDADGAALVLHAGPDDYRTDPSGGSGARIACGVIQRG